MPPAALELLKALAAILDRWGRWYLFGAQAVTAYGVPRLSADVDVTVALAPDDPQRFARDMEAGGFTLRVDDPEFLRRTRVMPFVHVATGMPLDVVLAGSGLEDEFFARAKTMDLGGAGVPVIDIADLLIAKLLAGRPKDVEDARSLWRVRGASVDRRRSCGCYGARRGPQARGIWYPASRRSRMSTNGCRRRAPAPSH